MSRGKDKSLVNVKWKKKTPKKTHMQKKRAVIKKKKNAHRVCKGLHTILELKTQCDFSDALVLRSSVLFKPTETIIVDPLRGKAATGPV